MSSKNELEIAIFTVKDFDDSLASDKSTSSCKVLASIAILDLEGSLSFTLELPYELIWKHRRELSKLLPLTKTLHNLHVFFLLLHDSTFLEHHCLRRVVSVETNFLLPRCS